MSTCPRESPPTDNAPDEEEAPPALRGVRLRGTLGMSMEYVLGEGIDEGDSTDGEIAQ